MSDSIFRIWSIARCEAKVIMRGWTFRAAFLLPLAFLLFFAATSLFRNQIFYSFIMAFYRVPAAIPWILMLFFTVYACVVLAALATGSRSQEFRLDTFDAVRTRPWSNLEYAAGKLAGQFICFLLMAIASVLLMLGIVLADPSLFVTGSGWILYPVMIFMPAFFFVYGSSVLISSLFRNQMLSLLAVTSALVVSLLAADRYLHLFDMTAFRLPLFLSWITGFSFPGTIAAQRLIYLAGGLSMVFFSVLTARRPPGRRLGFLSALVTAVALGIIALAAGFRYSAEFRSGIDLRREMRDLSRAERPVPRMEAIEYDLDVRQTGRGIESRTRIVLRNGADSTLSRYLLTLNPGLEVCAVTGAAGRLQFDRKLHLLIVYPSRGLSPGQEDTVSVCYRGIVDERAMFSDIREEIRSSDISLADFPMFSPPQALELIRIRRDLAPHSNDYILLVPDAMWYPVPGLPYDPEYPLDDYRDFSSFRIKVTPRIGLVAVSQGELEDSENGDFIFKPEYPLPGITLAIGEFGSRALQVDSVGYFLYSTPASEGLVEMMAVVSDTIPGIIAEKKDLIEYSLGLEYPFNRFSFLEVPASFCPFLRPMRASGSGYAQPEIFLIHERCVTMDLSMASSWIAMERKYRKPDKEQEKEMRKFWLTRSVSGLIHTLGQDDIFNVSPMFFRQVVGIEPYRYPHLGLLFDYFSGMGAVYREYGRSYSRDVVFSSSETASRLIRDGGFLDAVTAPEYRERAVPLINAWASHQYYLVDAMSSTGTMEGFIRDVAERYRFSNIGERELLDSFEERFGFRLEPTLLDLEQPCVIPGYFISGYRCCSFIEDERERYRLGFDVSNLEQAPGMIVVVGALKYSRSQFKMQKRKLKNPVLAIESFEPMESRHVEFVTDVEPTTIWIYTKISRNVPAKIMWGPGIAVRPSCLPGSSTDHKSSPADFEAGVLLVDDLDKGFEIYGGKKGGFLDRLIPFKGREHEYANIRRIYRDPPADWSRIIHMGFFGKYRRTAMCIRAGDGTAKATWSTAISEPGYYDVLAYIFDYKRGANERDRLKYGFDRVEQHYIVHHSDGSNKAVLKPDECEDGWNLLGRYYFEKGEAVVELSDESPALYVIADAVKWVRKD